jgi:hypothetical protein
MICTPPKIVWVIKLRIMRWVGPVARMGEERGVYRVLVGKREGNRPLGRQVVGNCECGNEPSGSIKCGEFLD